MNLFSRRSHTESTLISAVAKGDAAILALRADLRVHLEAQLSRARSVTLAAAESWVALDDLLRKTPTSWRHAQRLSRGSNRGRGLRGKIDRMRKIVFGVVSVAGLLGASVVLASSPAAAALKVIVVQSDTVTGVYTVSWQALHGCDPGVSTSGASGSMSWTVVDEPVETPIVVNDICEYHLSATFLNAAGATCRIAPSSLRITNDRVNLVVEPNSCTSTATTTQVITIRTDTVAGSYWVYWQTRHGCDPGVGTSGASGWLGGIVSGEPVEIPLVVNDTCEYDLSARFENAAGATCRIAPSSLRINNDEVNLVVEPNSCTSTATPTETGTPTEHQHPYRHDYRDL